MTKSFLSKAGMMLAVLALAGAGCAGGSKSDPAAAFKAGLEASNKANAAVVVTTPKAGETVTVPLYIEGTGAAAGAKVYAELYEFGNLATGAEVTAKEDGSFVFNQLWLLGTHDPKLELRVGEKDEAGNLIKFTKIPLTVNPAK